MSVMAFLQSTPGIAVLLAGGIGLFLHGLDAAAETLRARLGTSTRELVAESARRPPLAFLAGVLLSVLSQSSTAATSFAVGLVNTGLLPLSGAVVVMMGSSVGTAIVIFLLSLDVVSWAPLALGIGVLTSRIAREPIRTGGAMVEGISLVLCGMFLIKLAVEPLAVLPQLRGALLALEAHPFVLTGVSLLLTGILQSSAALMAVALALTSSGLLSIDAILPVVLGSHVGSSAMVLLAGMGGRRNARTLAWSTLLYKAIGAVAAIPFANLLVDVSSVAASPSGEAALLQGIVVIGNAALLFPLRERLVVWGMTLASSRREEPSEPIFLDDQVLSFPSLALSLVSRESVRLGKEIEEYFHLLLASPSTEHMARLRRALPELSEACADYLVAIPIPPGQKALLAEHAALERALVSLRALANLLAHQLATLREEDASLFGPPATDELTRCAESFVRECIGAFALGQHQIPPRLSDLRKRFRELADRTTEFLASGEEGTGGAREMRLFDLLSTLDSILSKAEDLVQADGGPMYSDGARRRKHSS